MTTPLRACASVLLAALCASGAVVPVAAQAPAQKKPAAAPAKNQPAAARGPQVPAQPKKPAAVAPAKSQPVATPEPPPAAAPPDVERPPAPESYSYKPEGRRDPFLSLVNRAVLSDRPSMKKPEGLRGLSWDEITLRGIFQGRKGVVALVQGPDTRTYQVRVGDQFFDAVVKTITADSLVVLQEVNDPLSLQKQRERRKTLRVAEEVK